MPPLLRVGRKKVPSWVTPFKPQVQKLINQRKLAYKPLSTGHLGYKPPPGPRMPNLPSSVTSFNPPAAPQAAPDYASLIGGDWEVQQAITDMGARMGQMRGDFQSGLRQALVDLGITDTSKLGGLGQYIDSDTIKKAAENKYSATAQIAATEAKSRAQSEAALAARGILSSGQTTKTAGDIAAEAESGRYSALREFLSGGQAGLRGLADAEYQMSQGIASARANAASRAADLYGMGLGEGGAPYSAPTTPVAAAAARRVATPKNVRTPLARPKAPPKKPPAARKAPVKKAPVRKGRK